MAIHRFWWGKQRGDMISIFIVDVYWWELKCIELLKFGDGLKESSDNKGDKEC